MRALAEDPWKSLVTRFPAGTTIPGVVTRVEAYGAFVEVLPGVEGLVHISKMTLDRRLTHARQAASVGQTVDVTVLAVDPEGRRLSLSLVEQARAARGAEAAEEKREHDRVLAEQPKPGFLGTFADLLASAKKE